MAYRITAECTACGICLNKCTNNAVFVTSTDLYAIDPCRCTECVDLPRRRCHLICPVNAIQPDPEHCESLDELWTKQRARQATPLHT